MAVSADFGINASKIDDSGIKALLEHLGKIVDFAPKIEKMFQSVEAKATAAAGKMSQSFVDADGTITKSQVVATDKVTAEIARMTAAGDKAHARKVESAEKTAAQLDALGKKQSAAALAEIGKIIAALEKAKAREIESEQKAADKIAALQAKSKGRTLAELESELKLNEKSKKEIVSLQSKYEEEVSSIAKKLTQTLDGEEKKRLKTTQAELKSELAAVNEEAEKRGIASKKKEEHGGGGLSLGEVGGLAVAAEGLSTLVEKSKEVVAAEHQLQVGTGLSGEALKKAGEDAEALGNKLGVSGDEAKSTMGKVSSYTHATGEELNKQTEAVIAYAQAHGKSAEMVAKKLSTAQGQAEIFAEAVTNVGKAQDAANEPAIRAQLTQQQLEEEAGKLASTLLQGLAPILTDLTPLIGDVGGIISSLLVPAMKIIQVVLTPVLTGLNTLKPILPELAVAIGILTIAFNAQAIATGILNAAMAVNPFVWIAAAVLALIGIVVLLVKHWDEVIATTKKVFSTIMDAGGAVLSFLGITGKAEAATRKHTDSLKENKKSLEEIKKSTEDAAKATSDYTDELKKNQDEQDKSAKEGQDNAIAAIVDIKARLKTATGAEKASLEERLAQWQAYGKKQVANAEEIETAKHEASLSIGAAADKEDTAGAKKAAKSKEDIRKESADRILNDAKEAIAAEQKTDKQKKVEEVAAEIAHANEMLAIAVKFHGEKSAQARSANNKLTTLNNALQADTRAQLLDDAKNDTQDLLSELDNRGIKENLSAYQIAQEKYQIDKTALESEISLRASFGEDTSKLDAQLAALTLKHGDDDKKNSIAAGKEILANKIAQNKSAIEEMRSHHASQSSIIDAETAADVQDENIRFADEMEKRKGNEALENAEIANHQGKMTAITRAEAEKRKALQLEEAHFLAGPIANAFTAGFHNMMKGADQWTANLVNSNNVAESMLGSILQSFTTMIEGLIVKFVEYEVAFTVLNAITGGGASALMGAFDALGAIGLPGHAEGTDSSPGGWHVVGERGMELVNMTPGAQVVPNHDLPRLGAPPVDLSPLLNEMRNMNQGLDRANRTFAKQRNVLPLNTLVSQQNQFINMDNKMIR